MVGDAMGVAVTIATVVVMATGRLLRGTIVASVAQVAGR